MAERVESMNAKPTMFQAGISNKFTKRHVDNFHDTTLTAASAAKQRAEKRAEKQAEAIDKQQQKIESEMKKIEEITQRLHRQQVREAKRLRDRLHFAATRVQRAFRCSQTRWRATQYTAAVHIQCRWRCVTARAAAHAKRIEHHDRTVNRAASVITHHVRGLACRLAYERVLVEREYAATLIQSVARMANASRAFWRLQRALYAQRARQSAAVRIQSQVRCYMTRLIYLDVLYVICRIQAAVRGFLIRRRLHWVAAIDIVGICKFQALARGFLVRQQLQRSARASRSSVGEFDEPLSPDLGARVTHRARFADTGRGDANASVSGRRRSSGAAVRTRAMRPFVQFESPVKRSYWLPAGTSVTKRLPVLPVKRAAVVESESDDDDDNSHVLPDVSVLHARTASALLGVRTPKKRNQRNRPPRLVPVAHPSPSGCGAVAGAGTALSGGSGSMSARILTEAESELQHVNQVLAERLRREDELKQKLLCRKLHERRRLEHEQRLRREQESEESERKLMEREEKLARLLLKVQHRRSKDVQIKKQSAEQQREERERIAMAREERQTRLLLKLAARHMQLKRVTALATSGSSGSGGGASVHVRVRGSRSRTELHGAGATGVTAAVASKRDGVSDPQDDDPGDMAFLDIDFKIPETMQKPKHTRASGGKRLKRKVARGGRSTDSSTSSSSAASQSLSATTLTNTETSNQNEVSDAHNRVRTARLALDDQDDHDGFDYGSEFEDIVDEAKLVRLIC